MSRLVSLLLGFGVIALVVGFVFAPWLLRGKTPKEAYVRDNEKLLETLPVFPGAAERARSVHNVPAAAPPAPPAGYAVRVVYTVPAGTRPRAVLEFYRRRMTGWEAVLEPGRGVNVVTGDSRTGRWSATFFRGLARMSIAAAEVERRHRFELGIDAYGAPE